MKKNILITLMTLSFGSFLFSATVTPAISMRFNDIVGEQDLGELPVTLVIGLSMNVEEGVSAGFDSDGTDSRIFVAFDYGTIGLGIDENNDPQFTIGGKYSALSNLDVSLDYIVNNLTNALDDDGVPTGIPKANELRLSLGVTF